MAVISKTQTNINKHSLPQGWQWVKLGDVAEYINGMAFKPTDWKTSGLPIIRIQNLTSPESHFNFYQGEFDKRYLVENGNLLISWSASLDAYIWQHGKAILNQHIFKVVEKSQIIRRDYLYYAVREAMDEIRSQVHGATMKHITRPEFLAIRIPLPPLDEQRRIAKRLNEQMAAVESARMAAEEQLQAARRLPSAYLREVFEGEEAKKWQKQRLVEVANIGSGITLGRKLNGIETRKVPYLRVANVKDGYLDLTSIYEIDATKADVEKCTLKYGDLLLTEGGDPDKLGRGTFWEGQISECLHQNHIFRVRFDLSIFSPQFIAYQLGSSYGKSYFFAHAKQTTGIATVNQKVLGNFPLLIPPFSEQKQIAETLKDKITEAEQLYASLESQLAEINRLPASLLREGFAGGL